MWQEPPTDGGGWDDRQSSLRSSLERIKRAARPPKSPDQQRPSGDGGGDLPLRPPPRQSSDSTLQPLSGRPSSAPSGRSSFESCHEMALATSEPGSQRTSFEEGGGGGSGDAVVSVSIGSGGPFAQEGHAPSAAGAGASVEHQQLQQQPQQQHPVHFLPPLPHQQQRRASGSGGSSGAVEGRHCSSLDEDRPGLLAPVHSTSNLALPSTRPRTGCAKHPAVLEHGSTAPPGAIDELAAGMLVAAGQEQSSLPSVASTGSAAAGAGAPAGDSSHSSHSSSNAAAVGGAMGEQQGVQGAARFAPPRRTGPRASSPAAAAGEPLLSSQVALLAQQLLLVQQQQQQAAAAAAGISPSPSFDFGNGSGSAASSVAAHLGFAQFQQQPAWVHPQQAGGGGGGSGPFSKRLDRSRSSTVAELVAGRLPPPPAASASSAARSQPNMLAHNTQLAAAAAALAASGVGPTRQQQQQQQQSQQHSGSSSDSGPPSPFSAVQGVYGAHMVPVEPEAQEASPTETSLTFGPRSSIDLLLDPVLPVAVRPQRHSLDTLQELLLATPLPSPITASLGSPGATVAQMLQRLPSSNAVLNGGGGSRSTTSTPQLVRHSMDGVGAAARALAGLSPEVFRSLSTRPIPGRASMLADPSTAFYSGHMSTGAMHDIANSTVTVVAGAVPVPVAASRATVSAHASSMVDPAAQPVAGTFEARVGTPEESLLDPDLHDTFGAHPFSDVPAARVGTPTRQFAGGSSGGNGGSRGPVKDALAMLNQGQNGSSSGGGGGSGSGSASSHGVIADGWRQPAGVKPPPSAQRPDSAAAGAGSGSGGSGAARPSAAAAAAATASLAAHQHTHPTVYQPHGQPADFPSPIGNAMMLDPSPIPGHHSITVHDPQIMVPSLRFLKQRALARQKLEKLDQAASSGGGYIAEAKRVLAAAVHTATAQEAAVVESSCSGAIGPLLRYLRDNKHNDVALRSGLHTLRLLVSNSPNRGIILSFHGQAMLCEAMRATGELEIRETIVQLLWDLEAHNKEECRFEPEDVLTLHSVLEATSNAVIASHILHLIHHCLSRKDPPPMSQQQMQACAQRLVNEIAAHKHHLQDAAQYTLGDLSACVLGDARLPPALRQQLVGRLLEELRRTSNPGQCQVVLTVLSSVAAGNARVRSALAAAHARRRLLEFGQRIADPRLRARSLSLVKILHKQEQLETMGGWYFGGAHGSEASTSSSPPSR